MSLGIKRCYLIPHLGFEGVLGVAGVWEFILGVEEENIIWDWLRINLSLTLQLVHNSQLNGFLEHQKLRVRVLNENSIHQLQGIGKSP